MKELSVLWLKSSEGTVCPVMAEKIRLPLVLRTILDALPAAKVIPVELFKVIESPAPSFNELAVGDDVEPEVTRPDESTETE